MPVNQRINIQIQEFGLENQYENIEPRHDPV
jgi:hypothetical protein